MSILEPDGDCLPYVQQVQQTDTKNSSQKAKKKKEGVWSAVVCGAK